MPRIRLKICGISTPAGARMAVAAGADAVGLDSAAFANAGMAGNDVLAEIALGLPPAVTPVLLSRALTAGAIAQQVDAAGATAVQLVRPLPVSEYPGLKRIIRGRKIIQSIDVTGREPLAAAGRHAAFADALHLAADGPEQLEICRQIAAASSLPIFLRLPSAHLPVLTFRPYAVDIAFPHGAECPEKAAFAGLVARLA